MKRIAIFMLAAVLASACKKEKHTPDLTGTYTGLFKTTLVNTTLPPIDPSPVQLIISGNTFKSGTGVAYITVGGGDLRTSTGVLNFTNNQAFPDNTSVNTSAVLNSSYNYTVKGDSLLLSKTSVDVIYTYKFKKQ
jgi:hypothetical protein